MLSKMFFLKKKIKFTSYVNYCSKLNQKKYSFFAKIKFTSCVNYCSKSSQKSIHFLQKLNSLVMYTIVQNLVKKLFIFCKN